MSPVTKAKKSFNSTTELSSFMKHQSASSVCRLTEKNWNYSGCTSHSILCVKWQGQEKVENPRIADMRKLPHTRIHWLWKCTYVLSNKFIFCVLQGQVSFPYSIFRSKPVNKHVLDWICWKQSTRYVELLTYFSRNWTTYTLNLIFIGF